MSTPYRIHAAPDPLDAGPRRWITKPQHAAQPPPRSAERQTIQFGQLVADAGEQLAKAIKRGQATPPEPCAARTPEIDETVASAATGGKAAMLPAPPMWEPYASLTGTIGVRRSDSSSGRMKNL